MILKHDTTLSWTKEHIFKNQIRGHLRFKRENSSLSSHKRGKGDSSIYLTDEDDDDTMKN